MEFGEEVRDIEINVFGFAFGFACEECTRIAETCFTASGKRLRIRLSSWYSLIVQVRTDGDDTAHSTAVDRSN